MTEWHKSSYSGGNNECVEVREHTAGVDARDTQDRAGALLFRKLRVGDFVKTLDDRNGTLF